jgi:dihydrofolate synthase / folylpolyglutamate synthase
LTRSPFANSTATCDGIAMTYLESLSYLGALGNEILAMKLGLESVARLLAALGDPHETFPSILVAGTNGKGSTCATLDSILRRANLKVGLYTSPHLVRIEERIRVNGECVAPETFAELISEIRRAADRPLAAGALPTRPTFFEHLTAAAFLHFQRRAIDVAVLEVGLGGRLDATNVVTPRIAVIANIGYDHQEYLGETLAEIAGEKAGIIKPNARVFIADSQFPEAAETLRRRVAEQSAFATWVAPATVCGRGPTGELHITLFAETIPLRFRGAYQAQNVALAAAAAQEFLHGTAHVQEIIVEGAKCAFWPGRLEWIDGTPPILLDGAHNPQGADALAEFLRNDVSNRPITLVFAAMRDKPTREILRALASVAERIVVTEVANNARSKTCAELAAEVQAFFDASRVFQEPSLAAALATAQRETPPGGLIVVSGSLYLVGEARARR